MFPRVERPLGCPSGACRISTASSAQLCRTGCAVAIRPPCETCTRFRLMPGPDPLARPAVSLSPSTPAASAAGRSGSKESLQISSALSDVASPIRGTTLRRKLGPRWRRGPVGLADRRALAGVCIRQLGGLRHAVSRPRDRRKAAWRRPPSLRVRTRFCARSAAVLHGHIAIALQKTGSIKR